MQCWVRSFDLLNTCKTAHYFIYYSYLQVNIAKIRSLNRTASYITNIRSYYIADNAKNTTSIIWKARFTSFLFTKYLKTTYVFCQCKYRVTKHIKALMNLIKTPVTLIKTLMKLIKTFLNKSTEKYKYETRHYSFSVHLYNIIIILHGCHIRYSLYEIHIPVPIIIYKTKILHNSLSCISVTSDRLLCII